MPLAPGTRLGVYEVTALIGEGGMGQVYRARDTKLDRDVAIKILPEHFASDADRLARFQREAKTLASLNHTNIAIIHGLEQAGDVHALVMELVAGEDLSQRITRGSLKIDEALPIAKQIAEALEAAHEQGIVHRDLKPANIKVRPDGTVKVLDFGLAKALGPAEPGSYEPGGVADGRRVRLQPDLSQSPTITSPAMLTGVGTILGTAAYMSPEQARGKAIDKRSDVWAFGCVLFEMLSGQRAFAGDEVSDVLAAVLAKEPNWPALPASVPPLIRTLIQRCLEKNRLKRIGDISAARFVLDQFSSRDRIRDAASESSWRRERVAWMIAVTGCVVVALALSAWALRPRPALPEWRVEITTPTTSAPTHFAISPDGRQIVSVATIGGVPRLWLRSLDSIASRDLPKTDNADNPFWSPDSKSVGFSADGKLKRISLENESVMTVADLQNNFGAAWHPDGTILLAPTSSSGLYRVPADGGPAVELLGTMAGGMFPQFLPDGLHYIYWASKGVYLGRLDNSETRHLIDADSNASYAATGHLLFVRGSTLLAQPFDVSKLTMTGAPVAVAEGVIVNSSRHAAVSTSAAGTVTYRTGAATFERQFIWFDRQGREIEAVGDSDGASRGNPALSPDGRRLAYERITNGKLEIWLLDLSRGLRSRLIDGGARPAWSPDGARMVFQSFRGSTGDLYQKLLPAGAEELLLHTPETKAPTDWSSDGKFILFRSTNVTSTASTDLWILPVANGEPRTVVQTQFAEMNGQFSPDGKWITYQSNVSGQVEVYAQAFPVAAERVQISTRGGAQPRWRSDSKEIYYIALDEQLMAVPTHVAPGGKTLEPDSPQSLFRTRVGGTLQNGPERAQYVVSPDGQRFLMNTITNEATPPITLLLNWRGGR
jgi:eukaryotic-like serine/threonine-protein kinase